MDKSKILGICFFILVFIGIGVVLLVKQFVETYDPILDFYPRPDSNSHSSLIWIHRDNDFYESPWEDQLVDFLREYSDSSNSEGSGQICTYENYKVATKDNHCIVDVDKLKEHFMPSMGDTKFGYIEGAGSPSFVLTLRTMDGWVPEPYTAGDLQQAKEFMMPAELQEIIRELDSDNVPALTKQKLNSIWISCHGVNPEENIGEIRFYAPGRETMDFPGTIPNYYFPYLKQPGYQIPFVIVQFKNPQLSVLIDVECRAWAKNIGPDEHKGFAKVEFELLID